MADWKRASAALNKIRSILSEPDKEAERKGEGASTSYAREKGARTRAHSLLLCCVFSGSRLLSSRGRFYDSSGLSQSLLIPST